MDGYNGDQKLMFRNLKQNNIFLSKESQILIKQMMMAHWIDWGEVIIHNIHQCDFLGDQFIL